MKYIIIVSALLVVVCGVVLAGKIKDSMKNDIPVCGGYRYDHASYTSMEDEKGGITDISFIYYERSYGSYKLTLKNDTLHASLNAEPDYYLSQNFDMAFEGKVKKGVENALRSSGLLRFNEWCVEVNGLPPLDDASISIKFDTGTSYYMSFNGGRSPEGFDEAVISFVEAIKKLCGFDPDKKEPIPPYVSPFWGTHKFVYEAPDGMKQTFIYMSNRDDIEVVSYGDYYSSEHIHCSGHKIYGGQERYDLSIEEYFEDSVEKPSTKNSTAAIIYRIGGELIMEPYQICPEIAGKKIRLKEIVEE